jgi:serine/threonine protein kinase
MGLEWLTAMFSLRPARVDVWRKYERLHERVAGTMSQFYKVRDKATGEVFGLKVIDPEKLAPVESRYKSLGKPSEAEISRLIVGPNIVRTLDSGTTVDGRPFIVQEFIDGMLLQALIAAKKPLPPAQRIDLVRQAAAAIGSVHKAGFVHRDICPRNFIVQPSGRLVLFDFGLTVPDKPAFLQPGNRVGTPNYLAPEVVRRQQADKRLDLFSFGATAYEICTLDLPWQRGSTGKAAMTHDSAQTDIRGKWPEIPEPLAAAIMACLAPDPAKRPATADAFLGMIRSVPG